MLEKELRLAEAADAGGSAGKDEIAGVQSEVLRAPAHNLFGLENQLFGVAILHCLSIQIASNTLEQGVSFRE